METIAIILQIILAVVAFICMIIMLTTGRYEQNSGLYSLIFGTVLTISILMLVNLSENYTQNRILKEQNIDVNTSEYQIYLIKHKEDK